MPGKAEGQADDNQRQPRRQGQGNSDQSRDDQNRSRDHPGRLDNTEHPFKVTVSPTTQATPSLLWVGSGPRHDIAVAEPLQVAGGSPGWQVAGRNPLKGKPETGINASCLEVGMTGLVILGRAGRTPLP